MKKEQNLQTTETQALNIIYFICSKKVIDFAKPTEVSKPFKSGYLNDKEDEYFIAVLNFDVCESHYNNLTDYEQYDFWLQELVSGTMDVSKITQRIKRKRCLG